MARRVKTNLVLSTIVLIAPVFGGCSMLARDKPGYSVEKQYVSDPAIDNPPAIQSQTHLAAGMVSEQNGQLQQAESSYKAALALEPDNSKALFSIARLLNSQKKYDQSIPYWESLVRVNKGSADSYSNLGYTYMLAERDSNSEQAFLRAISADPKHRRARLNYSQLLGRQGRMQDAATQMSAILPPAAVHFNLGLMYERGGNASIARQHYVRSLQFDPQFRQSADRIAYLAANPQRPRPLSNSDQEQPNQAQTSIR